MTAEHEVPERPRIRTAQSDVVQYTIGPEDDVLQALASSTDAGRAAKTLVKQGPLRIMLAALRTGVALEQYKIAGPISIYSLRGRLKLATIHGVIEVGVGDLVALDTNVVHSATALDDCTLLITLVIPQRR